MAKEEKTAMGLFIEIESAIQPLDEVVTLLRLVHSDFHLGDTKLSEADKFDLLMNYQKLGDMIMLATRTIERAQGDFYALQPGKAVRPDPEQAAG
jgi:hypothetical protein